MQALLKSVAKSTDLMMIVCNVQKCFLNKIPLSYTAEKNKLNDFDYQRHIPLLLLFCKATLNLILT